MDNFFLMESIIDTYEGGGISYEQCDGLLFYATEAFWLTKGKFFLAQINDIRKKTPAEYGGVSEVKDFVDSNYNDLTKIAKYMDEFPEKYNASQRSGETQRSILNVGTMLGIIASIIAAIKFSPIVLMTTIVATIFTFTMSLITKLIMWRRKVNKPYGSDIVNNLSKIKKALQKWDNKNNDKVDVHTKQKISDIIAKIDDAETAWSNDVRMAKD